jgi:drug/metabolite transporter (DMT)-like permease
MPPDVRTPQTYAALIAMCVIWGSTFLAIRLGNESVPPMWAATIRLTLATPLFVLAAWAAGASMGGGAALRAALGYGIFNYGVNFVLLYWGEQRVPSGTAAVMYATVPLTTAIFASVLDVHVFEQRQLAASIVGLVGVAVVFRGELGSGAPVAALIAVFGGATASALSSVILKKGPPQSTWVVNAIGAAAGAVICLAASLVLGEPRELPRTVAAWAQILYLVAAGNLGAYALYGWLITKWNVVRINVVALVIPLIAVVLGAVVRGEAPPFETYVGALLVLSGVTLTLFPRRAS